MKATVLKLSCGKSCTLARLVKQTRCKASTGGGCPKAMSKEKYVSFHLAIFAYLINTIRIHLVIDVLPINKTVSDPQIQGMEDSTLCTMHVYTATRETRHALKQEEMQMLHSWIQKPWNQSGHCRTHPGKGPTNLHPSVATATAISWLEAGSQAAATAWL